MKKPIQEKKGLVWAFQFLEKPIRSCCMGFPSSDIGQVVYCILSVIAGSII
jgi:hypothetical protein